MNDGLEAIKRLYAWQRNSVALSDPAMFHTWERQRLDDLSWFTHVMDPAEYDRYYLDLDAWRAAERARCAHVGIGCLYAGKVL